MEMDDFQYQSLDDSQSRGSIPPQKRRLRRFAENVNPLAWISQVEMGDACRRIVAFLLVQGLLIALLAVLLVVTKQQVLVTLKTPKPVFFELENCDLVVQKSSIYDTSTIDVSTQQSPSVLVSVNETADGITIRVKNDRDLYDRYAGYFCSVSYSPLWNVAPSLSVVALGRRQTTVSITGINFGNNSISLSTQRSDGLISGVVESGALGGVEARVSTGSLWLINIELYGDIYFNASGPSSLWVNASTPLVVHSTAPDSLKCITANEVFCATGQPTPTFNCTSIVARSVAGETPKNVFVSNPATSVSVLSFSESDTPQWKSMVTSDGHPTMIGVSTVSQQQAMSPFTLTPYPDVVYYSVSGPGSPFGLWTLVHNHVYLFFSEPFLDFSTLRLMSPNSARLRVPLYPSQCPGLDNDLKLSNLEPIYSLLGENLLAKQVTTRSDAVAFIETLDNILGQVWTLKKDVQSGEYYNNWPEARLIYVAVAVLNGLLAGLTGLGLTYVLVRNFLFWRREQIDLWGSLFYGEDEYIIKRDSVLAKADIFFMSEFLVGFPGKTRRLFSSMLLVAVHTLVIVLPAIPVAVAMILYNNSVVRLSGSMPATTYVGMIVLACFILLGGTNLIAYYLDWCFPRRLRPFIAWPFSAFFIVMLAGSITYLTHLAYWLVLGSMLRPDLILPFCSVAVLSVVQLLGTYARVSQLYDELRYEQNQAENLDALEEGEKDDDSKDKQPDDAASASTEAKPAPSPAASPAAAPKPAAGWALPALMGAPLPVTGAINVLQDPELLHFRNTTTREKIAETIVRFLILLLFYGFVLLGFVAFGSTALASGVSTALIVAAGGTFVATLKTADSKIAESIQRRFKAQIQQEAIKRKKAKAT
eukprot:TRINITY_DN11722_c0_g1_i1.p1 TRINITY_DN11722_c0_g1~~TRINITY_DN11722_c0_g1_i1.p1  ORF type:complete len:873 (-),score=146.80 TRINITY_DN11722_c0_g1_i1:354-2972(-)